MFLLLVSQQERLEPKPQRATLSTICDAMQAYCSYRLVEFYPLLLPRVIVVSCPFLTSGFPSVSPLVASYITFPPMFPISAFIFLFTAIPFRLALFLFPTPVLGGVRGNSGLVGFLFF